MRNVAIVICLGVLGACSSTVNEAASRSETQSLLSQSDCASAARSLLGGAAKESAAGKVSINRGLASMLAQKHVPDFVRIGDYQVYELGPTQITRLVCKDGKPVMYDFVLKGSELKHENLEKNYGAVTNRFNHVYTQGKIEPSPEAKVYEMRSKAGREFLYVGDKGEATLIDKGFVDEMAAVVSRQYPANQALCDELLARTYQLAKAENLLDGEALGAFKDRNINRCMMLSRAQIDCVKVARTSEAVEACQHLKAP